MSEHAIVLREVCGCVVGVTVIDEEMHYLQTATAWKRQCAKDSRLSLETLPIEAAREELGACFEMRKRRGKWHWRAKNITPGSCRALVPAP